MFRDFVPWNITMEMWIYFKYKKNYKMADQSIFQDHNTSFDQ
jgi:hypothetical protein